jgi:uncharacterized protein YaaR (DUF327 family)
MAASGPLDPVSPFFASIAGHAAGGAVRKGEKKKGPAPTRRFDRLLEERAAEASGLDTAVVPAHLEGLPHEVILERLLDDVHSAGDVLKEKQLPDTIIAYKEAVRHFIRYVVSRTYDVSETISGTNILKRKKFTQIQVLDEKLEQLAAGILSNQRSQMDLLGRIEEINGLLVDLMS